MMNNLKALSCLCNAIANTFYPDKSACELTLFNAGLDPEAESTKKDPAIFRCAVKLVNGYVEGGRNENGVSTSVRDEAITKSLRIWCKDYGLDVEEELGESLKVIENGSNFW